MGIDTKGNDNEPMAQINVIPFVDVVLVLLIIFMIAAPMMQQGIELELPRETITPIQGDGEELVVSINKEGTVFIGAGNQVEIDKIGERVLSILSAKGDDRVFIEADRRVDYGTVMAVMANIRRAGISKVGLITEAS